MRGIPALLIAGVTVMAGWPGAGPATAAPAFGEYVALGDSWSADATVMTPDTAFVPLGCAQNAHDYGAQVAAALAIPVFRDATCTAASTYELTHSQEVPGGLDAPQFDRLTHSTDLVTLGIGGNDAGLEDAVEDCLTTNPAGSPCRNAWVGGGVDRMSRRIAATEPEIVAAVRDIRARSPRARVLLVGYLDGVGTTGGCFPQIPMSDADTIWVGHKLIELNAMLARAAADSGARFVDTYRGSVGHDACQRPGTRWVEGVIPVSGDPAGVVVPLHPNQLGADHQARAVLAALGR